MLPYLLVFCTQQLQKHLCSAASSLHSTLFQERIKRSNVIFFLICLLLQLYIDGSEPRKMKRIRLSVHGTSRRLIIAANRRSRCRFVSKKNHACTVTFALFFSFVVWQQSTRIARSSLGSLPKEVILCTKAALPNRVLTC